MKYEFTGTVWYYNTSCEKVSMETTITIEAPNMNIARAILDNYGFTLAPPARYNETPRNIRRNPQ